MPDNPARRCRSRGILSIAHVRRSISYAACCATAARRVGVLLSRLRHPLRIAASMPITPMFFTCSRLDGHDFRVDYRAGGIHVRSCSAATRTGAGRCGSRELSPRGVTAEVSPLLRRRSQGGVPSGSSPPDESLGGRRGDFPTPLAHLPSRTGRPPAGLWGHRALPARPALAGAPALLRSTFTATAAPASARATRRAGPASSPSSSSRAANSGGARRRRWRHQDRARRAGAGRRRLVAHERGARGGAPRATRSTRSKGRWRRFCWAHRGSP